MVQTRKLVLTVEKRELTGRKVKKLREAGLLPASVYGPKMESLSVKGDLKDFNLILSKAGETGLVDLKIKGEKENKVVLLKNPQYHPVTDSLIHIDLYQVDLTQKVVVSVPVELVGESPAALGGEGILVQSLNEIEIEALPIDLPEKFIVDISKLEKIDDAITITDLKLDSNKFDIQVDEDQVVVRIEEMKEEEEEEVAPTETEVIGEGLEEGDETKEGEQKEGEQKEGHKEESGDKSEKDNQDKADKKE